MDRRHLAGGAIIILLILVLLFGGGAFGPGEEGGAGEGEGGIITCDSDEDCPGEQECVAGICKEPGTSTCEENSDCPEGQVCIEEFCFESDEIPCENTGDCPSGYECADGFCKEIEVAGGGPVFCNLDEDCPGEQVCHNNVCMSQEEADCVEQGGEWNEDTEDCTIECSEDEDCPEGEACHEGECMDPQEIPCDPPCKTGWVCVEGACVLQAELYSPNSQFGFIQAVPMSYCEGCPQEDSIVSNMFLDPDIDEKTVSAVLFVEEEFGNRTLVEDATIFIQVVPSDGSETSTCRIVTGEDGKAIFDYSEYEICDEVGCRLRFTFCCANITEGCLLPVCLSDNAISHYTDVSPCGEGPAGEWPEEAYVDGEFFNIYPAVQELSIPAQPQVIGTAFTFDLCFPVMVIFALLSAAMFATGRNPFRMFSLYTPRFKRAPMRAIRARGMTFNINSIAGSISSAAQGIGKEAYTMQDRMETMKKGVKNLRSLSDGSMVRGEDGKIRKVPAKGVKGEKGKAEKGGAAARGEGGAMGMQQETAIDLGDAGTWAIKTGATLSVGRALGVLAAMMGTGLMKKVLSGSGIFSWLVYGTKNFEGLVVLVSKGLKESAAPRVMAASGSILSNIVHEQGVDAVTGEIVITYTDPETGETQEARFENEGEAAKFFGDRYAGAIVIYAKAARLTLKQLREDGSPIIDACENVAEIGENEFGVSVSEEISHSEASSSLNDPTLSSAEVPGIVLRAKSLEGAGTDVVDSSAFGNWVTGLEKRVSSGETIPDSELRLAAAVFHRGYDELGGDSLNDHTNLASLGGVLVNATATGPGGEPPSPDELAFAEYSQSLVAAASADAGIVIATDMNGNSYDLGMEAMGTLSITSTMGEAALGEPLGGVGELESHPLRDMHENFSGEANPVRYKAASDGLAEAEQILITHAKDIVYSGVEGEDGGVYDDGTMQYLMETRGYLQRPGVKKVEDAYKALENDLDPTRGPMDVVGNDSISEEKRWEAAQQVGNYVENSRMDSMATTIHGASTPPSYVEQLVTGGEDISQEQRDQQMQAYYDLLEPDAGIDVASLREDAKRTAEKLILPFSPMFPAEPTQSNVNELRETVEVFRDAGHQSAGTMLTPEYRENIVDNGYLAAPEVERPEEVQDRIAEKQVKERGKRELHAMQREWESLQKMRRIAHQESHDAYHDSEEVLRANKEGFDFREYERLLAELGGGTKGIETPGRPSPTPSERKPAKPAKRGGKKRPKTKKPKKGGKKGEDT